MTEQTTNDAEAEDQPVIAVHARASKVGENGVKPDVFYALSAAGEFIEVQA